ncbi:MAG: hypothetical protein JKY56_09620 [Kofleriaceae bacterium]|nr:hypothetical protein [Kofleriaceae bacterium]
MKRLRSILLLGAAVMVSGPIVASAQSLGAETGSAVVATSLEGTPMSNKADMKEVILNVFGMT